MFCSIIEVINSVLTSKLSTYCSLKTKGSCKVFFRIISGALLQNQNLLEQAKLITQWTMALTLQCLNCFIICFIYHCRESNVVTFVCWLFQVFNSTIRITRFYLQGGRCCYRYYSVHTQVDMSWQCRVGVQASRTFCLRMIEYCCCWIYATSIQEIVVS